MERLRVAMSQCGSAKSTEDRAGGELYCSCSWRLEWNILTFEHLNSQENNIDHNEFAVKSEQVWRSMKEVDQCNLLAEN